MSDSNRENSKIKKPIILTILIILVAVILLFLTYTFAKRYLYNHYWDNKDSSQGFIYSSNVQEEKLKEQDIFIKNQENEYGEFLTGQLLNKDDIKYILEVYRKKSNVITCVVQFDLTKEKTKEYIYELSINFDSNFVVKENRSFKIEGINQLGHSTLILKNDCPLQYGNHNSIKCAEINFSQFELNGYNTIRSTYMFDFYVNYNEKVPTAQIGTNLDILSKYKYERFISYELLRSFYLFPWENTEGAYSN